MPRIPFFLAGDSKTPICIGAHHSAKYEKIFRLAALFELASGRQHYLAQLLFIPSFLDYLACPSIPPPMHSRSILVRLSKAVDACSCVL